MPTSQTHLVLRTLIAKQKPDNEVQALFAVNPDRTALLFVHGFTGNPIKTWSDFHLLLPECRTCRGKDLFFYSYDALWGEMNASAAMLRAFLDRLFGGTAGLVNSNLPAAMQRPPGFAYRDTIIVAHSLGAVIVRRALLDATRMKATWPARTKLVLYAPAHTGARAANLAIEAVSSFSFLQFFGAVARFASPLVDQLKDDSRELKQLLADTKQARKGGANRHLVAKKVISAHYERIVTPITFCDDPAPVAIPDTTHMSVCKPRRDFMAPLDELTECL